MTASLPEGYFVHTCLRCGKTWISHMERPKTCTSCKSPYWNIERGQPKGPRKKSAIPSQIQR